MMIRIVTDSTADLPAQLAKELGITVVPVYVVFGKKSYHDHIDISEDEFYEKLLHGPVHPTTSQPTPQDFVEIYNSLGKEAEGILSIHVSTKLSGTVNSAEQAKKLTTAGCPIEIIDSQNVSMALGTMVVAAARLAKTSQSLAEITAEVKKMVPNTRLLALFDTLEYLAKGGRIGKAKSLVGSILKIKPLLTLKEGEFHPVGQARNRSKGKERLLEFAQASKDIEDVCIVYSTTPDEAEELADSIRVLPKDRITISRLGPALGTHGGPGVLALVTRTKV